MGEFDQSEEALFDEYGNLEPKADRPNHALASAVWGLAWSSRKRAVSQSLVDGSLPIPSVVWSLAGRRAPGNSARACRRSVGGISRSQIGASAPQEGALVLAVRPVQINPYWQHGGHAIIDAIARRWTGGLGQRSKSLPRFQRDPDVVSIADFDDGDVVRLIEHAPQETARSLRSDSGLLSAACEFAFSLAPGDSLAFVISSPMRDEITPHADVDFDAIRENVAELWRKKIGPRKITVGDREVSDTVEAQTAFILVNATRHAFKPGPRNYDRIWIRDGSSQALALLWAGLVEEAKAYVLWYSKRIYENGMVPPILNPDGTINRGYGSDIEFDAQGEFVGIAADVYRITGIALS